MEIKLGLTSLGLTNTPVLAHASLKRFGQIGGGADTLLAILLECTRAVIMPSFTYQTMITPEVGPPNNGITHGSQRDVNLMAEPFTPGLPAHKQMGILPEALRRHPAARRSVHPILSFTGIGADRVLAAQTLREPLAPIGVLAEQDGWILLLGVDQTVNTAIHYGERLAGRKQFVRWALTSQGAVECPGFPGCSDGFQAIEAELERDSRRADIGSARVQAIPLKGLLRAVTAGIKHDPLALLCQRAACGRCDAVRASSSAQASVRTNAPATCALPT